jgi:hypothetical protein
MNADTNERITDGARGVYEKSTGYVIFLLSYGEGLELTNITANM